MKFDVFETNESEVRSYCRKFPTVFCKAKNALLTDTDGREYIDFFAGAGAINFGHNNKYIKDAILDYLSEDRIIHALDMYTEAKEAFIETLEKFMHTFDNMEDRMNKHSEEEKKDGTSAE